MGHVDIIIILTKNYEEFVMWQKFLEKEGISVDKKENFIIFTNKKENKELVFVNSRDVNDLIIARKIDLKNAERIFIYYHAKDKLANKLENRLEREGFDRNRVIRKRYSLGGLADKKNEEFTFDRLKENELEFIKFLVKNNNENEIESENTENNYSHVDTKIKLIIEIMKDIGEYIQKSPLSEEERKMLIEELENLVKRLKK